MNPHTKGYTGFLLKYLKTQKLRVLLLALVLAAIVGLQLVNPQISRYFIDEAINSAVLERDIGNLRQVLIQ